MPIPTPERLQEYRKHCDRLGAAEQALRELLTEDQMPLVVEFAIAFSGALLSDPTQGPVVRLPLPQAERAPAERVAASSDDYTPPRPDVAGCPHCGAAIPAVPVDTPRLSQALLLMNCPECGLGWGECRKADTRSVSRAWTPTAQRRG